MAAITQHERAADSSCEYYTPREIWEPLGAFNLDPCAPAQENRLWNIAPVDFTKDEDGLEQEWRGRVWLNPPYGDQTEAWMRRLALHGDGVALIFARTETKIFFPWVWDYADGIYFLRQRIKFFLPDGTQCENSAGGPSVLVAYGRLNAAILSRHPLEGRYVPLR